VNFLRFAYNVKWRSLKPTSQFWLWVIGVGLLSALTGTKERPVYMNVLYTELCLLAFCGFAILMGLITSYERNKRNVASEETKKELERRMQKRIYNDSLNGTITSEPVEVQNFVPIDFHGLVDDYKCPGCGRTELHKMCPAWGTPIYMSGQLLTPELEEKYKEQREAAIEKSRHSGPTILD
jgi:hypothetical protein